MREEQGMVLHKQVEMDATPLLYYRDSKLFKVNEIFLCYLV